MCRLLRRCSQHENCFFLWFTNLLHAEFGKFNSFTVKYLIRTPKGQCKVSALERCLHKRGHYYAITYSDSTYSFKWSVAKARLTPVFKKLEKSADFAGFSLEKSQNSRNNRLISGDFRGRKVKIRRKIGPFRGILAEKSQFSKDFQGQILRKIGRFHRKFRGETSPRNNQ